MIENEQTTSNSFKNLKKNLNSCISTQYLNEKDSSITLFKQKFILLLENYTNKIKKLNVYNQFIKNISNFEFFIFGEKSSSSIEKAEIYHNQSDSIDNLILFSRGKRKLTLKIIVKSNLLSHSYEKDVFHFFDTFVKREKESELFIIYNQILILRYLENSYFILHDIHSSTFINKEKIFNVYLGINTKNKYIIVYFLAEKFKKFYLMKYEIMNPNNQLSFFANINSSSHILLEYYTYNSLYQFNDSHFLISMKSRILLFELMDKLAIIIQNIDISFSNMPLLIPFNNELILKSSGNYFYGITLTNKVNPIFTIFNEVTLNFNNNKYLEMLDTLKVIIYFNCEIKEKMFTELKEVMNEFFHSNNIYSYVENLEQILTEENINFFLFHNLENFKFKIIIAYALINEKYSFMTKMFNFIIKNKTISCIDEEIINFMTNQNFHYIIIYILEVIKDLFENVTKINIKSIIDEFFSKILKNCEVLEESHKYISYYIEEEFKCQKYNFNEQNYSKILNILLDN